MSNNNENNEQKQRIPPLINPTINERIQHKRAFYNKLDIIQDVLNGSCYVITQQQGNDYNVCEIDFENNPQQKQIPFSHEIKGIPRDARFWLSKELVLSSKQTLEMGEYGVYYFLKCKKLTNEKNEILNGILQKCGQEIHSKFKFRKEIYQGKMGKKHVPLQAFNILEKQAKKNDIKMIKKGNKISMDVESKDLDLLIPQQNGKQSWFLKKKIIDNNNDNEKMTLCTDGKLTYNCLSESLNLKMECEVFATSEYK